ncbi:hypothetical protein [Chitinophaga sancti]|uniref:Transposase n=1 Tax=Chitinophaga sancti TaxID=1004 RepID=A0ABZ0XHN0_9BACT|nr:hypothetical protein [Chitinophaga sancti]WQD64204.1 hypothetical protein U0033_07335 [Chitinophaga sancti]WQG90172.1 hypothetical protein SR876_01585 [Chitinophaga sancti]
MEAVKMALGNGRMWLESMQPSRLNFKSTFKCLAFYRGGLGAT